MTDRPSLTTRSYRFLAAAPPRLATHLDFLGLLLPARTRAVRVAALRTLRGRTFMRAPLAVFVRCAVGVFYARWRLLAWHAYLPARRLA